MVTALKFSGCFLFDPTLILQLYFYTQQQNAQLKTARVFALG